MGTPPTRGVLTGLVAPDRLCRSLGAPWPKMPNTSRSVLEGREAATGGLVWGSGAAGQWASGAVGHYWAKRVMRRLAYWTPVPFREHWLDRCPVKLKHYRVVGNPPDGEGIVLAMVGLQIRPAGTASL